MFHPSSAMFHGVVCWGGGIKMADTNQLNKPTRRPSSVLELEAVVETSLRRMLRKPLSIPNNPSLPLVSLWYLTGAHPASDRGAAGLLQEVFPTRGYRTD